MQLQSQVDSVGKHGRISKQYATLGYGLSFLSCPPVIEPLQQPIS
jgi:hypothetical protein